VQGHRGPTIVLVLVLASLTGCLVSGALDPTGGGRLTLKLRLVSVAHFEPLKAGLQNADVILKSASMTPKKWATFELECADVRKLSTAPSLNYTSVALTDGDEGTRTLAVSISNSQPQEWPDVAQAYFGREFRLSIDLPGDVMSSNGTSTSGRTVSWTRPLGEVVSQPRTDLTATFKMPDAKTPPGATGVKRF
jgi:hypothetical protein